MPLTDDEFSDLLGAQTSVHEATQHPGYQLLIDRLKVDIANRQETMIAGGCKTWEEYRKMADWLECAFHVLQLPALIDRDVETHRQLRAEYEEQT